MAYQQTLYKILDDHIKQKVIDRMNRYNKWEYGYNEEHDVVSFRSAREWEFEIDSELLYCMKSKDILIKYEDERNETENNPSGSTCGCGTNQSCERADSGHRGRCNCGSFEECRCN